MNLLVLDFETYFDHAYNLKHLTIPEYVHDARFHAHGVAIHWPDGHAEFAVSVESALDRARAAYGEHMEKVTVACHNAMFDLYILNHRFGLRPRFFVDTMLMAYHLHGRREKGHGVSASLGSLAEVYGLPCKGDLDFMQGVRFPDTRQLAELSAYGCRDAEITCELARKLLPKLTRPEVELPIIMHTVRLFAERFVCVDTPGIGQLEDEIRRQTETFLQDAGVTAEDVSKDKRFTELLAQALRRTGRSMPMKPGKNGPIPAMAKKDAAMQALLEDGDPVVAALASARVGKKGEDPKLARLKTLRAITRATGGGLPPYLVYCGANTGRFAGGGKFNLQNMGRTGLGLRTRELLVPKPGHVFVVGDLGQIEARITASYAGQQDMVAAFAAGRDIYAEFATATFGCEVRKPLADDPPDVQRRLGGLRQVGKQAILGLGFGMGALKFLNVLKADPQVTPLFQHDALSPALCNDIVRDFRGRYAAIPGWWRALEAAVRTVATGGQTELGPLRFSHDTDEMLLWLPSGRALRYPGLRFDDAPRSISYLDEIGQTAEFTPEGPSLIYGSGIPLYGGKLAENVVQATARDLLVEAILRLEQRGIEVLFHVHDEIIAQVPEEQSEEAERLVKQEMTTVPPWAGDLPLACEVKSCRRYGK